VARVSGRRGACSYAGRHDPHCRRYWSLPGAAIHVPRWTVARGVETVSRAIALQQFNGRGVFCQFIRLNDTVGRGRFLLSPRALTMLGRADHHGPFFAMTGHQMGAVFPHPAWISELRFFQRPA